MKIKSKNRKTFDTIINIITIVVCFGLVLFIKSLTTMNWNGYYIYNPTTQVMEAKNLKNIDYWDEMEKYYIRKNIVTNEDGTITEVITYDRSYAFQYNNGFYVVLDNIPVEVEYKEVDERPIIENGDDVAQKTLYIIKTKLWTKENFERTVEDPLYYIVSICMALCVILTYNGLYQIRRDSLLDSEEFHDVVSKYNDKVRLKPNNFDDYIAINNLDEKKRVYKEKISLKISKLKYKLVRITKDKLDTKKAKKIENQIESYENQLSDEYIDENIFYLDVKYYKLDPANFRFDEYEDKFNPRQDRSYEKRIMNTIRVRKGVSSLLASLAMAGLVTSVWFSMTIGTDFWVLIGSTVLGMLIQIVRALIQAEKMYKNQIKRPLENKCYIIEQSVQWANGNPPKTYEQIVEEALSKKIEEAENKAKEEYAGKISALEDKFKDLKQKTKTNE